MSWISLASDDIKVWFEGYYLRWRCGLERDISLGVDLCLHVLTGVKPHTCLGIAASVTCTVVSATAMNILPSGAPRHHHLSCSSLCQM